MNYYINLSSLPYLPIIDKATNGHGSASIIHDTILHYKYTWSLWVNLGEHHTLLLYIEAFTYEFITLVWILLHFHSFADTFDYCLMMWMRVQLIFNSIRKLTLLMVSPLPCVSKHGRIERDIFFVTVYIHSLLVYKHSLYSFWIEPSISLFKFSF